MAIGWQPATMGLSVAVLLLAVASPPTGLLMVALAAGLRPPDGIPTPGLPTLLVGATILGCVFRLPLDRPPLRIHPAVALLGAFVFYVAVQQTPEMLAGYSGELGHLVGYQSIQLGTGFGLVLAVAWVLPGRDPRPFIAAAIASAVVAALLAIATYDTVEVSGPLANLVAPNPLASRAIGPFGNPNYFGVFQSMAITAAVGWFLVARGRTLRAALIAAAIICTVALVLTLSRGGIVTLLAGLSVLAFIRFRMLGLMAAAALLAVALVLYPTFVQWRLGDAGGTPTGRAFAALTASDQERVASILAGPRIWASAPVFGVGFGHYSFVSARFSGNESATAAHNWYINVLAEQGLVGAALWVLFLLSVALALRRVSSPLRPLAAGVLAGLVVASMFLEPPTAFQTVALPIVIVGAVLAGRRSSAGPVSIAEVG